MQEFAGRTAVVTGAASGIGFGLSEAFAELGMRVVMADIHQDSLDASAAKLSATGAEVLAVRTDVSDAASVAALADAAFARFGNVHVLCNNAGAGSPSKRTWQVSIEEWQWMLGLNLGGVVNGIHAFVPRMLANGDEGHIVNTASMAGMINGGVDSAPYNTTKHAVVALTESLYKEFKVDGARLSASVLCPGWVATNIGANTRRELPGGHLLPPPPPGAATSMVDSYTPAEIAQAVVEGIREDRFYLLPAQSYFHDWMKLRFDRIMEGRNPAVPRRWLEDRGRREA